MRTALSVTFGATSPKVRGSFERIVIRPYGLFFSRRPTVLLLDSPFCILHFAFCIFQYTSRVLHFPAL